MTAQEIIKALDWCKEFENNIVFNGKGEKCVRALQMTAIIRSALENYTRQQAEIERLKRLLRHEERSKKLLAKTCYKNGIKEFAEQVKMKFYYHFDEIIPSIMADEIDNLIKEMEK